MKKWIFVVGIILTTSFILGCDQIEQMFSPKEKAKPAAPKVAVEEKIEGTKLAKVNNKVITLEEFEQNIQNLEALSEEIRIDGLEMKKSLLDEMINQELLYQDARSRGIQDRKEIRDLADGYLRGLAVRQLIIDITENITVDAQEIEVFYNQYKDELSEPEQRRVREIVISSEDRARETSIALLQGEDFATIAKERSIGESSKNAGDIGLILRGQRGAEYQKYDDVAFSLDKGQLSSIFKGPKGYYIIRVEEINEAKEKALADVWDQVKNTLLPLKQQQRLQDLVDKLKRDATIEINEDLIQ